MLLATVDEKVDEKADRKASGNTRNSRDVLIAKPSCAYLLWIGTLLINLEGFGLPLSVHEYSL